METLLLITSLAWLIVGIDLLIAANKNAKTADLHRIE